MPGSLPVKPVEEEVRRDGGKVNELEHVIYGAGLAMSHPPVETAWPGETDF